MTANLKPCPFCGEKGEMECVVHYPGCEDIDHYYIQCVNCEARMEELLFQDDAEEAWNTRPLEDALKAHAVEVLADIIFQRKKILRFSMEQARAEAMQLLGVKDGEL